MNYYNPETDQFTNPGAFSASTGLAPSEANLAAAGYLLYDDPLADENVIGFFRKTGVGREGNLYYQT